MTGRVVGGIPPTYLLFASNRVFEEGTLPGTLLSFFLDQIDVEAKGHKLSLIHI